MPALVPDEKCGVCLDNSYFCLMANDADYSLGPVAPSTADGTPLVVGSNPGAGKIFFLVKFLLKCPFFGICSLTMSDVCNVFIVWSAYAEGSNLRINNFPNSQVKIAAYPCHLCSNTVIGLRFALCGNFGKIEKGCMF